MGFLDKAKKSLTKALDQHGDTIEKGADELGRTINATTRNKHGDKIATGQEKLKKGLDGLDGTNDDFPRR